MKTVANWSSRADVLGARLADADMGAENRRIMPFGPCAGVEFVTLEGIVQPFPLHFHDFWTIGQMVGGNRRMRCRGQEYLLGSDDFVLFGPGEVHGCEPVGDVPLMYRSIVIPDDLFVQVWRESRAEEAGGEQAGMCRFEPVVVRDVVLSACMARLYAFAREEEAEPLEEEEALFALLARVVAYCGDADTQGVMGSAYETASSSAAAVAQARAYIDERYAANVTLEDLAHAAGVSRYHLIRTFSAETGLTPHRYLQAVRANRARDLLAAGVDPAEAAVRVGFSDQAHLGRVYKSFYGVTPGRYRTDARERFEGVR